MKNITKGALIALIIFLSCFYISCDDDLEDTKQCNDCTDDSPYSTVDSDECYATLSLCNDNETGNCVMCQ